MHQKYYYKTDTIVNHLKHLLDKNILKPSNRLRRFENFEVSFDESVKSSEKVPFQCEEDTNLLDAVIELCKLGDMGFKVVLKDNTIANLVFYKGEDKTLDQDKHPPVLFSKSRENILDERIALNRSGFKNVLTVIGPGEEDDKFTTTVGEEEASGYERYEGFINAQDIDPENEGEWLSPFEYRELLKSRGNEAIKEFKSEVNIESQIKHDGNLRYREDFEVGDLVNIKHDDLDLTFAERIMTVEEIYEGGFDIRVTFGEKTRTIGESLETIKKENEKVKRW